MSKIVYNGDFKIEIYEGHPGDFFMKIYKKDVQILEIDNTGKMIIWNGNDYNEILAKAVSLQNELRLGPTSPDPNILGVECVLSGSSQALIISCRNSDQETVKYKIDFENQTATFI